jgi:hypothetical protein
MQNPAFVPREDYSMERPDPDLTRLRKIGEQVDVNPFRPKWRTEQPVPNSTYRTYFRNFFPAPADAKYTLSSPRKVGGGTFTDTQRPVTASQNALAQINPMPFDIESRKFMGIRDDINSTYRKDYIDFDKTPVRKDQSKRRSTAVGTQASRPYHGDVEGDISAHNFTVRPGGYSPSTIYRDNYVNFMRGQHLRTIDE